MIRIGNFGFEYEGCRRIRDLPFGGSIGEVEEGELHKYKRKWVYYDGLALFSYLKNELGLKEGASVLSWECNARDVLRLSVAASMLGASLTLSSHPPASLSGYDLIISPRCLGGDDYLSSEELDARILGERSTRRPSTDFSPRSAVFGFISQNHGRELYEYYSENALLMIGSEYISAASLIPASRQFSVFSPSSREGFIFGLLAPAMIGALSCYISPSPTLLEALPPYRSSRLLCYPSVAGGLADNLGAKPPRAVTVIGDLPADISRALLIRGIYHVSMLSFPGGPLVGFRDGRDPAGVWKLPCSLLADMCNVAAGGIGSLTFHGDILSAKASEEPTFTPWQYRRELGGRVSLVSDLYGFALKKGRFFVKGRIVF